MTNIDFPLYHGTSNIFLPSILEHGLGKINPSYDFHYLETLKCLFELAEQNLMSVNEFRGIYDTTRAMSMQAKLKLCIKGKDEIFNFRHDGIYLALSIKRAISYATVNKYGSEILSTSIILMDLLDKYTIDYSNIGFAIDDFLKIREVEAKPIILKILKYDENDLDKEDGKTAKEGFDFLRVVTPTLGKSQKDRFFQYCNFKMLKPISPKYIEIFEVEFDGRFGEEDFEYTLQKVPKDKYLKKL